MAKNNDLSPKVMQAKKQGGLKQFWERNNNRIADLLEWVLEEAEGGDWPSIKLIAELAFRQQNPSADVNFQRM